MVRPPRLILAELKTDRGKVTSHHAELLELLGACPGVETYLWRPADFDTIARGTPMTDDSERLLPPLSDQVSPGPCGPALLHNDLH